MTTIVWLSHDLRVSDNPALHEAAQRGPVVPVYILAAEELGEAAPGGAQRWWLHRSLERLSASFRQAGSPLILRRGTAALPLLRDLAREAGADRVVWNERPVPPLQARDDSVASGLREAGIEVVVTPLCGGSLLHDPWAIRTGSGNPYSVFTPFWKSLRPKVSVREPLPAPGMQAPDRKLASDPLEALELLPRIHWYDGLEEVWQPGEEAAQRRLRSFLKGPAKQYDERRNLPAEDGTSRLSPHLHFGELSPGQAWRAASRVQAPAKAETRKQVEAFLRELGWREFCHHVLIHQPHTTHAPLKEQYAAFPWREDDAALEAWQRGRTGYPMVDAGMRQLWRTGWMHNRVRMVVASFLTKHLLLHWRHGARWFEDTLVDADLANNSMGWQWAAGSGADAQPYFRIFNPMTQGEKFDPEGRYVRHWLPELAGLETQHVHQPWSAEPMVLRASGLRLGQHYPEPIVEHKAARERALRAYDKVKGAA